MNILRCSLSRRRLGVGAAVVLYLFLAPAFGRAETLTLNLEQARALAERGNPVLRQAMAEREAIEGRRQDAQALLYNNPTVFTELARRRAPGTRNGEWTLGIEQPIELAGQPRLRRAAVDNDLAAQRASVESLRRSLMAEVDRRFLNIQAVLARLRTEEEALELIERSAAIVRSRVAAGEDTRLEGNLAEVEVGRMRNQLDRLRESLVRAQSELGTLLQLPSGTVPITTGELAVTRRNYVLATLIETGQSRPALTALAHREDAERSRLELERALRYPDLTIGFMTAREGASPERETIAGLTFSLPLPLFRRNAEGIGRAYADLSTTRIERSAAKRNIVADITALWEQLSQLAARRERLNAAVLPPLKENMRLAQISYQTGEISISELLLANRQVVEARRDVIDATLEHELTRVALEEAAGWPYEIPSVTSHGEIPRQPSGTEQ
ncbi:MAG: TolC family protein [Burkholderiales bacterium]